MIINNTHLAELNSPRQTINARVELYRGSTLEKVCTCHDVLSEFSVTRTGSKKFFGYGISQKIVVNLFDLERELDITNEHTVAAAFGVKDEYIYSFPLFYVKDAPRDETTNTITITAHDALYNADKHTVAELALAYPYTVREFMEACASLLGLTGRVENVGDDSFNISYGTDGANLVNFDGTETIRAALDAIAEVTQTIYYINKDSELTFKRLDIEGAPVYEISADRYIELKSDSNRRLGTICHATELGDNISASTEQSGTTQYIRDNPFWELRDDVGARVDSALAAIGGLTINQFECSWMGNYLVEMGDKISLIKGDLSEAISYLLDDTINYDGALSQLTSWRYEDSADTETADNPTSLGEALNKTFARVDKLNKQIEIVASTAEDNKSNISALEINVDGIAATVSKVQENTSTALGALSEDITKLTSTVEAKMSAEDVTIAIQQELSNGVDKVTTSTGFTFNEQGLTIEKSGSEMTTAITEDGMRVYKNGDEMLTADNQGVKAIDLHATTYLIVGGTSRFENYDNGSRTGCFWIGD